TMVFSLETRRATSSTLFPYTTLFRSSVDTAAAGADTRNELRIPGDRVREVNRQAARPVARVGGDPRLRATRGRSPQVPQGADTGGTPERQNRAAGHPRSEERRVGKGRRHRG